MAAKITPRHKMLGFYGVPVTEGDTTEITYTRMRKFTQLSQSKNPIEYNRQYVDEQFQQTDVMGYSPTIDYAFDRYSGYPMQEDIIKISDEELVGEDAVRSIILVDTETGKAIKRDYSVIPNTEGDNINIYTYSGTLKCRGEKVHGTATSEDNWQTVTFTESTSTD